MTAQAMDHVSYAGQQWGARALPLNPWLRAHPDVLAAFSSDADASFLWRGYLASWAVVDGKLWLTDIKSEGIPSRDTLQAMLPLLAGWVTGGLALLSRDEIQPPARDGRSAKGSTVALLTMESGTVTGEQYFPATIELGPGGLGIRGVPPFTGLVGDDSYWGLGPGLLGDDSYWGPGSAKCTWLGAASDAEPSGWGPSKPLFDDSADRWGLLRILEAAGVRSLAGK